MKVKLRKRKTSHAKVWEHITDWDHPDSSTATFTDRLPVPGGWIYRTQMLQGPHPVAMVFVPDPRPR
jgi:hypothetical protein